MIMKDNTFNQYAVLIGLDWANKKNDVCLLPSDTGQLECDQFEHTPKAIENWVLSLHQRFLRRRIAICLEFKNGPIVYTL